MAAEDTTPVVEHDDNYYIQLGKQAAADKALKDATASQDKQDAPAPVEVTPAPFSFGPMAPVGPAKAAPTPAPLTDAEKEDALIARILAAVQKGGDGAALAPTQPAKPASKEDQRVLNEMSRLFPSGRDTAVNSRVELGNHLFLVDIAYTPHSGVRHSEKALILDNGKDPIVVWRAS